MVRPPRPASLAILGLLALFLAAPAVSAAPEAKVFKEQNFELTPPNDAWQWMPLDTNLEQNGYVARLGRRAAGGMVIADIRVVPTNGLPLADLTQEVSSGISGQLPSVQGTRTDKGTLSGIEGTLVTIKGTAANDAPVLFKIYSIEAGGKFHQLLLQFRDGAEKTLGGETENLKRGYRLLEGAGPEEKPVDPHAFAGGAGDLGSGPQLPEGGPELDGNTYKFDAMNFHWTVPAGSPFKIDTVTKDAKTPPQKGSDRLMIGFVARKGEEEGSDHAIVMLVLGSSQERALPKEIASNANVQNGLGKQFFDRVDFGRTQVMENVKIGNYEGAALEMVGTKQGRDENQPADIVTIRFYWVRLKNLFYEFRTIIQGGRAAAATLTPAVDNMMGGIEFLDTVEAVLGPVGIPSVAPSNLVHADGLGEEKDLTSVGFTAKKPDFMAALDFDPQHGTPNLRLAWEARSKDKQKYLYYDVQSFPYDPGMKDPEKQLVEQREGAWLQLVESPQTKGRGDEVSHKDRLGRAKGLGYEFTGTFAGNPFKEIGWAVRYKKYLYLVRIQLGGDKAEDEFKKEIRKLERCLDF